MATRVTLTRDDWIHAAQSVLIKSGVDAVRVDTVAKQLKITRGSFYHHFGSRDELLQGILNNWRARATEDVIMSLRNTHGSPESQLTRLLELPYHGHAAQEAAAIELGIRAWARSDLQARQAIDEVDKHRLSYIEGLLQQLDLEQSEARDRAHLIYTYQLGLSLLSDNSNAKASLERNQRMSSVLVPTPKVNAVA